MMARARKSPPTLRLRCHRESSLIPCTLHGLTCAVHHDRSVIWKLMSFTFAMITLPIGTYFFTVNFVFQGEFLSCTKEHC